MTQLKSVTDRARDASKCLGLSLPHKLIIGASAAAELGG